MARAVIAWILLASAAVAQIESKATTQYIVSGIDGYSVVGDLVVVPEGSRPKVSAVGLVEVDCDASMISVRASDSQRKPVEVRKIEATKFLVLGQGRLWVDVTCIDFERQFFDQSQFVIDVGDSPDPEPEPDPDEPDNPDPPDVPDDAFDNIGKRVAAAAIGKPSNESIAKIYKKWAEAVVSDPTLTVSSASGGLVKDLAVVPGYSEAYADVRELINTDVKARWPLSKGVLSEYWMSISRGFASGS